MKVLHIAESFGGGVATAMAEYVHSTPDVEHYLLYGDRSQVAEDSWKPYVWSRPLGVKAEAIRTIRRTVEELKPDVVHAQSSFAGAYARVALRNKGVRIVYTPHCFAFQRRDISKAARLGYRVLERGLAMNTEVVAGCSPYEAEVARGWRGAAHAVYVPNIARVESVVPAPRDEGARPLVVGLGRLSIQKDPDWFAALAPTLSPVADLLWIGGGEPEVEAKMRAAGVQVTGWASRSEAMAQLAAADCFIMSSLWEGFPMAILESEALGVPTLLRQIEALPDSPAEVTVHDEAEAVRRAKEIVADPAKGRHNLDAWRAYLVENTPEVQRERLLLAYGAH